MSQSQTRAYPDDPLSGDWPTYATSVRRRLTSISRLVLFDYASSDGGGGGGGCAESKGV